MHDGILFAALFDLNRLQITGEAVPAIEHVATNAGLGTAQFAFSNSGSIAYLAGGSVGAATMTWMAHDGRTTPLRGAPADWSNAQFAPDGRRVAMDISDGKQTDVWVYEWQRDILSRLTLDRAEQRKPVWTPDGRRIAFRSGSRGLGLNLYWQRTDGSNAVERLTNSGNIKEPGSWHPSGRFLAFTEVNSQTGNDLMVLPMDGDETSGWKPRKPTVFLQSPFSESEPIFSPDGQWIAYQSNETGRDEVYVRPFPAPGGKSQVSTEGGTYPTWSRTRKELFYVGLDRRVSVASYTVDGASFKADKPRFWSEEPLALRPRGIGGTAGRKL